VESGLAGIALREEKLAENWEANRISTYHYLSSLIELAHQRSILTFSKNKMILVRYPKWSPALHKRPDEKLRKQIFDAYAKGQIDGHELEFLEEELSSLLARWDAQWREISSERKKLRYSR
tara:strand:+ start:1119 stop:1481 length:363 start_codon:yes stop_codon:yes gene_type:complete